MACGQLDAASLIYQALGIAEALCSLCHKMMFNILVPGASAGYAVGGTLIGIALGSIGGNRIPLRGSGAAGADVRR
jgi:hypothetical protein